MMNRGHVKINLSLHFHAEWLHVYSFYTWETKGLAPRVDQYVVKV